jgi:hypothetical protein
VLDAVRALGIEVRGLTADEGRLDVLYRELVAEAEAKAGHEEAPVILRDLPSARVPKDPPGPAATTLRILRRPANDGGSSG